MFFKTQLDEKTKLKTSSSAGSKLERIISLRTEKVIIYFDKELRDRTPERKRIRRYKKRGGEHATKAEIL